MALQLFNIINNIKMFLFITVTLSTSMRNSRSGIAESKFMQKSNAFEMYGKMPVEFIIVIFYFNKLSWPSAVCECEKRSLYAKKKVM